MRSRSSRSSRSSIASHRIASHRIASHSIASLRIASIRIASLRIPSIRIASHRLTSLRIASLAAAAALSHYFVYGKSKHDSSRHMRHIVPQLQRLNLSGARSASMPLLTCLPPTYIHTCVQERTTKHVMVSSAPCGIMLHVVVIHASSSRVLACVNRE